MTQFSRNTIVEIIDALGLSAHADIESFLIRFEMEEADNHSTLDPRKLDIVKYLIENPNKKGPYGANLVFEIAEFLLENNRHRDLEEAFPRLVRSLKRNGYIIEDSKLKTILPEKIHLAEAEDELTTLLKRFKFTTAKGHFEQALSAHTRGDWAGANSQLRPFIESLFDSIAETLCSDKTKLPQTSHARKEFLTTLNPPFLQTTLNEWEPTGKGFVQGFWYRLHPSGPHPGLSDEEDSTFRLHLVLIVANHNMRRLVTYSPIS
jgi:hypothetical protein